MSKNSFLLTIISIDIAAIIIAIALPLLIQGKLSLRHFDEKGLITYLSFLQLLVIAGLAFIIFKRRREESKFKGWRAPYFLWLILVFTSLYLAIDEIIMIHENIDFFIHRIFNIEETGLTDRIDDAIIGIYGLCGLTGIYLYRKELSNYRAAFPLLVVTFICFFLSVFLDILNNGSEVFPFFLSNQDVIKYVAGGFVVIEEMFKIIAEGIFLGFLYYCLLITRRLNCLVIPLVKSKSHLGLTYPT